MEKLDSLATGEVVRSAGQGSAGNSVLQEIHCASPPMSAGFVEMEVPGCSVTAHLHVHQYTRDHLIIRTIRGRKSRPTLIDRSHRPSIRPGL